MGSLKGKRVLITGSTGFVGANLVRMALKNGAEIHAIIRKTADKWRLKGVLKDIESYDIDLLDYRNLESAIKSVNPDIIYHTATYGGRSNQRDTNRIINTNLIGTINLINACKEADFDLFVNTGSSSEYGVKSGPMQENDRLEPINDYGISKSAATLYCQATAKNEELPIVTLRLFSPYGNLEDATRLMPSIILACLRGESPRISSPKFVRDFIYIDDVLDAYANLTDAPQVSGNIFNIGYGKQCTVGEVANKIIELTGNEVKLETGIAQRWPNEPEKWEANISKASDYLGWKPKYNLEKGLVASISWFKQNIKLYK